MPSMSGVLTLFEYGYAEGSGITPLYLQAEPSGSSSVTMPLITGAIGGSLDKTTTLTLRGFNVTYRLEYYFTHTQAEMISDGITSYFLHIPDLFDAEIDFGDSVSTILSDLNAATSDIEFLNMDGSGTILEPYVLIFETNLDFYTPYIEFSIPPGDIVQNYYTYYPTADSSTIEWSYPNTAIGTYTITVDGQVATFSTTDDTVVEINAAVSLPWSTILYPDPSATTVSIGAENTTITVKLKVGPYVVTASYPYAIVSNFTATPPTGADEEINLYVKGTYFGTDNAPLYLSQQTEQQGAPMFVASQFIREEVDLVIKGKYDVVGVVPLAIPAVSGHNTGTTPLFTHGF